MLQTVQTMPAAFPLRSRDYTRTAGAKARAVRIRDERRRKSAVQFLALAFGE